MDRRFGTGGGGMSVRFSGDTDAFSSEPSVEAEGTTIGNGSAAAMDCSWTSLKTCDTMAGLGAVFRRRGFEMGELLMLDRGPLALAALFFLAFLARSMVAGAAAAAGRASMSISTGELLECVLWS